MHGKLVDLCRPIHSKYGQAIAVTAVSTGLGWAGLGWAGLGWAGLGWAGLGRAVLDCIYCAVLCCIMLCCVKEWSAVLC